jgi:NADPH:quinone reductase-like Zn-dependent oxidoreductase
VRAYVVDHPDGPFTEVDIPRPVPLAGQVLVGVCASGVNPLDTKIRAGKADHAKQPLPAVLGLDMAGVVEEVAKDVTSFRTGDEVYGMVGGVGYVAVQLAKAFGAEVFATVSAGKQHLVEALGATAIDYRALSTEQYVGLYTEGQGFDVVYDTVGGATLDASFVAVRRYTGHVVSCLGWSTHSLAPLSLRGATYSGVFTLMPLLTGFGQAHHGEILREAAALADGGKLKPLLNQQVFTPTDIAAAHALVESGSLGKVVIDFQG